MRPDGTTNFVSVNDYYFEHRGLEFIGLDLGAGFPHGEGLTTEQMVALNALWEREDETPKVVFMHHPGYDEGGCPTDVDIANYQNEFVEWCDSSNTQLVLSGHSHQNLVYDKDGGILDKDYP